MSDVRYVVLSDLHLGAGYSLLTECENDGAADPMTISAPLAELATSLARTGLLDLKLVAAGPVVAGEELRKLARSQNTYWAVSGVLQSAGKSQRANVYLMNVEDGGAANDLVISGNITQNSGAGSGAKSINKSGAGTLLLSGANSFTGGVNVNAGTVKLGHLNAFGITDHKL